jgi:hypothetical protein
MTPWDVAGPILLAVLVGAALPLLLQASAAVRSTRRLVERLDRIAAKLDDGRRVEALAAAIDDLSAAARQVKDGVRVASAIGAALGPAAGAAVRAWRESAGPNGAEGEEKAP